MERPIIFKGEIQLLIHRGSEKKISLDYSPPTLGKGYEDHILDTMMCNFKEFHLSTIEKQKLSRAHRKILHQYRHLNLFSLNQEAKKLILEINQSKETNLTIKAKHYGAYICLVALYSGKLSSDKKLDCFLENIPLALFPKAFLKKHPDPELHKIHFEISKDSWLNPFTSLYNNQNINYSSRPLKKAA